MTRASVMSWLLSRACGGIVIGTLLSVALGPWHLPMEVRGFILANVLVQAWNVWGTHGLGEDDDHAEVVAAVLREAAVTPVVA